MYENAVYLYTVVYLDFLSKIKAFVCGKCCDISINLGNKSDQCYQNYSNKIGQALKTFYITPFPVYLRSDQLPSKIYKL